VYSSVIYTLLKVHGWFRFQLPGLLRTVGIMTTTITKMKRNTLP
jgi:hypothetical protein